MVLRLSIFWSAILLLTTLHAQNELDALRYSYTDNGGTARSLAMGNAFGALGADLSALHINPAGLALYRKSEISIGLGNEFNNTEAVHYGTTTNANTYNFNLRNLGIAMTSLNEKETSKWKSSHFGISYARTASFNQDLHALGFNPSSSLLDQFVQEANGTLPEDLALNFPFTSSLAWETYTMDPLDTIANTYIALFPEGQVEQDLSLETSGRMSKTAFTFGMNYDDKLYLGAGLSFVSTRYEEHYVYKETRGNEKDELLEFEYEQDLETRGSGVEFNFGLIYRIGKNFRAGASIQSPSLLVMNDIWSYNMKSKFADGTSFDVNSPEGEFAWNMNTPMRLTFSGASIIGARGLISIDYELLDMGAAKLKRASGSPSDYDFSFENERINEIYTSSNQLRIGTEWKVRRFIARGGFNMRQYPIKQEYSTNSSQTFGYSAGIGYRIRSFSLDLSYKRTEYFQDRYLYSSDLVAPTAVTIIQDELIIGLAYRY